MSNVIGPFIEYECSRCGTLVHENAPRNPDRLTDRIAEANAGKDRRICAGCWNPSTEPSNGRAAEKEGAEA